MRAAIVMSIALASCLTGCGADTTNEAREDEAPAASRARSEDTLALDAEAARIEAELMERATERDRALRNAAGSLGELRASDVACPHQLQLPASGGTGGHLERALSRVDEDWQFTRVERWASGFVTAGEGTPVEGGAELRSRAQEIHDDREASADELRSRADAVERPVLFWIEDERVRPRLHSEDRRFEAGSLAGRAYLYDPPRGEFICMATVTATNNRFFVRSDRVVGPNDAMEQDLEYQARLAIAASLRAIEGSEAATAEPDAR